LPELAAMGRGLWPPRSLPPPPELPEPAPARPPVAAEPAVEPWLEEAAPLVASVASEAAEPFSGPAVSWVPQPVRPI
jgi:hypothetical protein